MTVETNNNSSLESLTPMMRQYWQLKEKAKDAILFFRMGDFYEIFDSDAETVAPILEVVLTSREKGDDQKIPFCGVPHHSARNYYLKLLKRGFKVALADQIEDPALAKGIVKRDIVKILTPGCIDDPEGLDRDSPNYLAGAFEEPSSGKWAFAVCDISTGEFRLGSVAGMGGVREAIERLKPKEILVRRFVQDEFRGLLQNYHAHSKILIEELPELPLRDSQEQQTVIQTVFGKKDLGSQPSGQIPGGEALVSAMLTHLKNLHANITQFLQVRPLVEANTMALDETAIRDLELFETTRRRDAEGSLFREINQTLSPMGTRLLRYFLAHPLLDSHQIRHRHNAVRLLLALGETKLKELRSVLKNLPDLERLATRIFAGSASPTDLARVQKSLVTAKWIVEHLTGEKGELLPEDLYKSIAVGLKFYKAPAKIIEKTLVEEPSALGVGLGVIKPGFDQELDRLNEIAQNGETSVLAYQEELRKSTGIGSLKIKGHKTYGLTIEVTRTHATKIPSSFIRKQTMVNCDRFVTPELSELSEDLTSANEKAAARERDIYQNLLSELGKFRVDLTSVAQALATFDMLQSFAWQALLHGYCEPRLSDDDRLELKGSRHPVVERFVGRHNYAPNDITLSPQHKHLLITGPNMAGKSTVMRQTAVTAILCQIGSFVPALSARIPVFDRIFTRVGASDDLSRGQSTFMVEMSEAATILRHASQKSLVILDEVGRGTSTRDGLALAGAILHELATKIRCFCLFATHYHELVPLSASLPQIKPMRIEVLEHDDKVVFTHHLVEGATDNSYGLEVARIAGIPESVLKKAHSLLGETETPMVTPKQRAVEGARSAPLEQKGLATKPGDFSEQVLDRLKKLNLNRLTPIQALNILEELQNGLYRPEQPTLFREEPC